MRIPERYRLAVIAGASVLLALLVVAAVLLPGRIGPAPTPPTPSATKPPSATPDVSTPEGAVRAFFEAFARARRTDDPAVVRPFVTSEHSDAYRSAQGFLVGQRAEGKASVITRLELTNFSVTREGNSAMVLFDYLQGGYDIDLDTGKPLESPVVLPAERVSATVRLRGDVWLVESYASR